MYQYNKEAGKIPNKRIAIFNWSFSFVSGSICPRKDVTVLYTSIGWQDFGIFSKTDTNKSGRVLASTIYDLKCSNYFEFGRFENRSKYATSSN
jgi:hypothetical protein